METKCPCCKDRVGPAHLHQIARLLPFDGFPMPADGSMSAAEAFLKAARRYPELFQWACDDCIREGKAILARPSRQHYTFGYPWATAIPYLAYYDQNLKCRDCEQWYVFSKEEQRHWYEELQFVVYVQNIRCPECRKTLRAAKDLNTELSDLLRDGKPEDPMQLARIGELYQLMGKTEKAKAYSREAERLRKRN